MRFNANRKEILVKRRNLIYLFEMAQHGLN